MNRVIGWTIVMALCASLAVAAILSLSPGNVGAQDKVTRRRQEDIVVKPGKGSLRGGLEWTVRSTALMPGSPYHLRDDAIGDIQQFEVWDPNGGPYPAGSVSFTVDYAGEQVAVSILRKNNKFEWDNSWGIKFKECNHNPAGPKPCLEGGIPPLFMEPLVGTMSGTRQDGTPVGDVTQFRLQRVP